MLKKILPLGLLILVIYPPFKSWFYSQKFKGFLEDMVRYHMDEIAISRAKFENSIRNELLEHISSYNVVMKNHSLSFYWADDTLVMNVDFTVPVNYWFYRLYPQYHHYLQVDLREIMKAKKIKEDIERRYRSLP